MTNRLNDNYYRVFDKDFWMWGMDLDTQREVVCLKSGKTIAYASHVKDIMDAIRDQGLPPFGALVAILAALGDHNEELIESIRNSRKAQLKPNVEQLLINLKSLPDTYKSGDRKKLLIKTLFQYGTNAVGSRYSERVVDGFDDHPRLEGASSSDKIDDMIALSKVAGRLGTVDEIMAAMGDLPAIELPVSFDEHEGDKGSYVDQLAGDTKTWYIAELAKYFYGTLNIPIHAYAPSEQPLGGFSDIANKGDFDKLLTTEFAYDDISFMSRLANNEALYIQKEIPPVDNNRERFFLIDVSLKNWGSPKLFGMAMALSLLTHPENTIRSHVFLIGNDYKEADLLSREHLIDALQYLEPVLEASVGLEKFFKDHPNALDEDVILFTEESTFKYKAWQGALTAIKGMVNYTVQSTSDGRIDVFKLTRRDRKHVQRLVLPLEELQTRKQIKRGKASRGAILGLSKVNFPILVRSYTSVKHRFKGGAYLYYITKERTLLRSYKPMRISQKDGVPGEGLRSDRGLMPLVMNLPKGNTDFAIGEETLLMFNRNNRQLTLLDLQSMETRTAIFDNYQHSKAQAFWFLNGTFFHANSYGCWSISLDGKVEDQSGFKNKIEWHISNLARVPWGYLADCNVLKKIRTVGISRNGNFMINQYVLSGLTGRMMFNYGMKGDIVLFAALSKHDVFKFPDGSTVTNNRAGLLILSSSNPDIPDIYVPSVLTEPLGLSTEQYFTGNKEYQRSQLLRLTLEEVYDSNEAIRRIQLWSGFGEQDILDSLNKLPVVFGECVSPESAQRLKNSIEKDGNPVCKIVMEPMGDDHLDQEKLEEEAFETQFLQPFIDNILAYANQD